jgi:hypothetical protein
VPTPRRACAPELADELRVPHWLMERVYARHSRFILPDSSFSSLGDSIAAACAALLEDLRAYEAKLMDSLRWPRILRAVIEMSSCT